MIFILVHRDIKSSNILLDEKNCPKICDFGLIRAVSQNEKTSTQTQATKGTPAYMPPESNRGNVSPKFDVWSFGVVLLEIVSGLPVIDNNRDDPNIIDHFEYTMEEIEEQNLTLEKSGLLSPIANWNIETGSKLLKIAEKCLQNDRRSRPTMRQITEENLSGITI